MSILLLGMESQALLIDDKADWVDEAYGNHIYSKTPSLVSQVSEGLVNVFNIAKNAFGVGSNPVVDGDSSKDAASSSASKFKTNDTIHVFSLASGHLYERFLKIMMLSVSRRTTGERI